MDPTNEIFNLIRDTVRAASPKAEIFLFGSRSRGTNRPDSDWDVLVLIDMPFLTPAVKDIDYQLWSKGLEYGQEINTIIRTTEQWNNNQSLFKHNVTKDRIKL